MSNEILSLTQKLIAIESIKSKPENLQKAVKIIADYFHNTKLIVRRYEKNQKPSIVVLTKDTKHPKLFLNVHLDVVEAEPDQFQPKIERDKLYGRGSFDVKGYVAMCAVTLKKCFQDNPRISLGLMLTTDEEIGGENGVGYLLNQEKYTCEVAFVPDGGVKLTEILTDEKGVLHLKLIAHGKAAHGAFPWKGENALDILIETYQKIRKQFPNPRDEQDWKISLNLGKIVGGQAPNKVPDQAEMLLDIRFPAPETPETIIQKVKQLITDKHLQIEMITSGGFFHTEPSNPYLQTYQKIAEAYLQKKVNLIKYPAASDARFFSEKGIPVIMNRGQGGGQHGVGEWASISDYEKASEILMKFIKKVC